MNVVRTYYTFISVAISYYKVLNYLKLQLLIHYKRRLLILNNCKAYDCFCPGRSGLLVIFAFFWFWIQNLAPFDFTHSTPARYLLELPDPGTVLLHIPIPVGELIFIGYLPNIGLFRSNSLKLSALHRQNKSVPFKDESAKGLSCRLGPAPWLDYWDRPLPQGHQLSLSHAIMTPAQLLFAVNPSLTFTRRQDFILLTVVVENRLLNRWSNCVLG